MKAITGSWLSLRQSSLLGRRNAHAILKLALLGRIRVKVEAGESIRFAREDVERLPPAE